MYVFFFYTVCGSILLLIGILLLYNFTGTLLLPVLNRFSFSGVYGYTLWMLFFFGFAVKVPLVPFHTWLPEAHVEAPTGGSIILAGLLLKVGTYGMLRFMVPMLNSTVYNLRPITMTIGLVSIFYASMCALRQTDMKKIIAYSSVAHMGLVIMGLFSMSINGCVGAIFIMFSHGIVAGALFYSIGILYNRYHSRYVTTYSGMAQFMPIYFTIFFTFILANMSFPGTSAFSGELMILVGIFYVDYVMGVMATFSIVFPTLYSMWMYNRLAFGEVTTKIKGFSDLNKFEIFIYVLFLIFMIAPGMRPALLIVNLEQFFFLVT
jgi:NADH-quinone oxidoreductase subunit M